MVSVFLNRNTNINKDRLSLQSQFYNNGQEDLEHRLLHNIQRANLEVANALDNLGSLVIDDVHSADSADRKAAMEAMEEAHQVSISESQNKLHPWSQSFFR